MTIESPHGYPVRENYDDDCIEDEETASSESERVDNDRLVEIISYLNTSFD